MKGPSINDKFPNLRGSTQETNEFDLYEFLGSSWCIVAVYPCDFNPVSLTEMGAAVRLGTEFESRDVKFCGFSCGNAESHVAWVEDIRAATGAPVKFPIFSDPDQVYSSELGILDQTRKDDGGRSQLIEALYVLRPDRTIALHIMYASSTGRNFYEVLREIDALQVTSKQNVATPHNWQVGERVFVESSLTDLDADQKFHKSRRQKNLQLALPTNRKTLASLLGNKSLLPDEKGGYTTVEVPSERGKHLERHYVRYTKDPLLESFSCPWC